MDFYIPVDGIFHSHCCENLKSYMECVVCQSQWPPGLTCVQLKYLDATVQENVRSGWAGPFVKVEEYCG
jgi:hypothetical protein